MEDDLKLSKVEYLSNRLLDHTQFWNISLYDPKIFCHASNKDDLQWKMTSKYLKEEYLSNHLLEPTHILNLSLDDQNSNLSN
jgi:hypothetical protein